MANRKFVIIVDSIAALGKKAREQFGVDDICPMTVSIDDKDVIASPDYDQGYSLHEYFDIMRHGKRVFTSQVPVPTFEEKFGEYVNKGCDILYIACSGRLSKSVEAGQKVAEKIMKEHPEAKIVCFDGLNSNFAIADMARKSAAMRAEGKTLDEVVDFLKKNVNRWNQFGTVETLTYLKQAGRVKASKAFFGNIFGVKPIFISDRKGNNFTINKVKGTKASLNELFEGVKNAMIPGETTEVFIGQGMAQDRAESLKKRFEEELNIKATVLWIGPIVGTTCGPGVIATFCRGKEVTRYDGDGLSK